MRRFLVLTLTVLLLIAVLSDAKKKDAKKDKGEKLKREVETKVKKEKDAKINVKPTKVKKQQSETEAVATTEDVEPQQCSESNEEHLLRQDAPIGQQQRPHIVKPKSIKVLTEYEKCKLDCKKKRDQADLQEYVQRLKEELAHAEAALAEEQKLHEQQQQIANSKPDEQSKEPVAETKINKPGDE